MFLMFFFFNVTATTEIDTYGHTLSLHDALPICQMGDAGILFTADGAEIHVTDTQKKLGELHVHVGKVTSGGVKLGDAVEMRVEGNRRAALRDRKSTRLNSSH